jgi:hypothetical protein
LRKEIPAICRGDFAPLDTMPGTMAYLRRSGEQSVLVAMNFSKRDKSFSLPNGNWQVLLTTLNGSPGTLGPGEIQLLILE